MLEPSHNHAPVKTSSNRSFGLVFAGVFFLITFYPLLFSNPARLWVLPAALFFLTAALLRPAILAPLNRRWTALGGLMHKVMAPLLMGLVFFIMFVPMGLIMRLMGKRPLALRYSSQPSYWLACTPRAPDFFTNQF